MKRCQSLFCSNAALKYLSVIFILALSIPSVTLAESKELPKHATNVLPKSSPVAPVQDSAKATKTAVFAGGCFWCMEPPFEKLTGVLTVVSGYSGGPTAKANPTYKEVSAGGTGHLEVVQVSYDPAKVTYEKLLEVFWRQIDPTDPNGQFVDQGESYKSAIFYAGEEERLAAEKSRAEIAKIFANKKITKPIVTEIRKFEKFYPAEDYHQDYYKVNPIRYKYYRGASGRDDFLEKVWGTKSTY
jgi:peptide methionine sulfoxide reductase msrA/msrB